MKRAAAKNSKKEKCIMKKGVGYKILGLESITGDAGVLLDSQTSHTSAPPTLFVPAILRHHQFLIKN